MHSRKNLPHLAISKKKFRKNPSIFPEKNVLWEFQEILPFETHSRKNLPQLAILKKFKVFSDKTHLFFQKTPNFECFQNSYYSSRILRQICYNLVKKNQGQKRERNSL